MANKKVTVSIGHDECYFHVFGDVTKYYSLDALVEHHPECEHFCINNSLELNRELHRQRELLERA